jgi:RNA polymerase sigma factor (sigma-70 family)
LELKTLIEGCKKNNREAQSKLYDLLAGKLFSVCLRYSRNREEAKDLLQESYIKIFQNISHFNGEGSFEGWCRRIATNTSLSYLKTSFFVHQMGMQEVEKYEDVKEVPFANNLELNELLNMLNQLSLQKKVIFNLYEIEGYSHSEIAEMLNITDSASRGQLAKAKQDLRKIYEQLNKTNSDATNR